MEQDLINELQWRLKDDELPLVLVWDELNGDDSQNTISQVFAVYVPIPPNAPLSPPLHGFEQI